MKQRVWWFAVIAMCWAVVAPAAGYAQPSIFLPEKHFNFGEIAEGVEGRHEFIVENRGTRDLKIDRVQTSCGCTSSFIANQLLKPMEKTTLTAIYDTENRPGPFTKEIRIFSDDPASPETLVTIEGVVKGRPIAMIGVEPSIVNVGKIRVNEARPLRITISNIGEKELEVYDIGTRDGLTKLWDKNVKVAPGDRIELDLVFRQTRAGSFREVFLVLSNARRSTVSLVVSGIAE